MKNQILSIAALAAVALAGCTKSAQVNGEGATALTLDKPAAVTVHRGGMAKADVKIKRSDLPGDVTIHFTNLPKGVDVVDESSKLVGDHGSYTFRATETADLVENFAADVTASGGAGHLSVSEPISISVKAKE